MGTVSMRDLSRNASGVVDEVARTGRPALVTKHGAPVAALVPVDQSELEDLVLAKAPAYRGLAGRERGGAASDSRPV